MKQAYGILINDLLQQYHVKAENLRAASAVADAVRQRSQADYAFRLSIGLEGLLSTAEAAGDVESASVIAEIASTCNSGMIPQLIEAERFTA